MIFCFEKYINRCTLMYTDGTTVQWYQTRNVQENTDVLSLLLDS